MATIIPQTTLSDADLARKKSFIVYLQNLATEFAKLDDAAVSAGKLITNRKWTGAALPDVDVAEYGVTAADVTAFVSLLSQFAGLMSSTTINGRKIVDIMRSSGGL